MSSEKVRCGSTNTTTGKPCRILQPREKCPHHGAKADLADKERRFVEEYTVDFNAAAAARRAGYSEKTAKQIGHIVLHKPHIAEAIQERLDELAMTADEALVRLAAWGRAEDIESIITIDEDGNWDLDLRRAKEEGKLYLIKRLSYDRRGNPRVEVYDAMEAVKQIARTHGLFRDTVVGPDGGPIEVMVTRKVVRCDASDGD